MTDNIADRSIKIYIRGRKDAVLSLTAEGTIDGDPVELLTAAIETSSSSTERIVLWLLCREKERQDRET